jgi:hypothetical protein
LKLRCEIFEHVVDLFNADGKTHDKESSALDDTSLELLIVAELDLIFDVVVDDVGIEDQQGKVFAP